MRTKLIDVNGSSAVVLPAEVLAAAGLPEEFDVLVEAATIVLRPAEHPRSGWEAAFRKMALRGDDELFDRGTPTEFDENE